MAVPARILAVNLGSQAISVAEFRPQGDGGLILRGYQRRELVAENPADAMRQAQITSTLREMLDELGIKNANVNYAVPAQSVFARFVKLPAVDEEKIDRIIAFEAPTERPVPDRRSGLGLSTRWRRRGRAIAGGAGRDQIRSARRH